MILFFNYNLHLMYYFFFYVFHIKSLCLSLSCLVFLNYFSPLAHYSFHCAFFFFLTWYLFNFLLYSLAFFIYYLYIHFVYFVGSLAHFKFTYFIFSGMVPSFLASFSAISSISIWQFNSLFHLFLKQCFQCLGRLESVFC